jgi:hypothetical protein
MAADAAPRCVPRGRSATSPTWLPSFGLVPSPWSEATKGLFRIADVPVLAVRRGRDAAEITAWTGVDNVPVVFHAAEPARTNWAAIIARIERQLHALCDRLRAQQALGHTCFGGPRVSALDVYLATFVTPLSDITPEDCPQLEPVLRRSGAPARRSGRSFRPSSGCIASWCSSATSAGRSRYDAGLAGSTWGTSRHPRGSARTPACLSYPPAKAATVLP